MQTLARLRRHSPLTRINLRRLGLIVLLAATVALLGASPAQAFTDVPVDHPYAEAIADLAAHHIIEGYPDGRFGPADPVLRQQFAKMIVLTMGLPVAASDVCPFRDVAHSTPPSLYPDHFVAVAAARRITTGKTGRCPVVPGSWRT